MSASPRVSVVIPVFNNERYLARTIRSVLDQTAEDFELVVADQCSSDGSRAVAESFEDPRIRIVTNDVSSGAVPNWNLVTSEARGRYLKLLCADDLLYPTCLERQVAILDDPSHAGVALVTARHDVVDEDGRRMMSRGFKGSGRLSGREAIRVLTRSGVNLVGEPAATLFRADAYRAAGPWLEQARYVVDLEMWTRLLLQGDLYVVGETLSAFRVQRESWSNALADTQQADMRWLFERLGADEAYGLRPHDVFAGSARSWVNTQLRQLFYRLFLGGGQARPA